MTRNFKKSFVVALVGAVVVCGASGCTATSRDHPGQDYLLSLKTAHRLDPKADVVCTTDGGEPVSKPLVAANATLSFVRSIEAPGSAKMRNDPNLSGKKQGYAAICLMRFKNNGQYLTLWEYALPDRETGFIDGK